MLMLPFFIRFYYADAAAFAIALRLFAVFAATPLRLLPFFFML